MKAGALPRACAGAGIVLAALVVASAWAQPGIAPGRPGDPRATLFTPGAAPFGSAISEDRIPRYHRATHQIGTSGPLTRDGVIEAKRLGFVAIVDLQGSPERSANERRVAEYAHIAYFHLPVAQGLLTEEQLQKLAEIVQDPANLPVLLHGDSVDQVGAAWALFRARQGVPPAIALVDGLTAGLGAREQAVRTRLGLPPR
jgi:protein tyrosine phosphatase (PTP) superfamily phosphohydrolase (DUF442 family)